MLDMNQTMVYGDSRSLRNFFNDLCNSLERAEGMWEEVEAMENQLDTMVGIEAHRDELVAKVRELEELLESKDKEIDSLKTQVKDFKKINKDLTDILEYHQQQQEPQEETTSGVPKLPKKKKKIIVKKTRL